MEPEEEQQMEVARKMLNLKGKETGLEEVRRKLKELEEEGKRLQEERERKMEVLNTRLQVAKQKLANLPRRFEASHPVVSSTGRVASKAAKDALKGVAEETRRTAIPVLKVEGRKFLRWAREKARRVASNQAFASTLYEGQSKVNPETGQRVTKHKDGSYTATPSWSKERVEI